MYFSIAPGFYKLRNHVNELNKLYWLQLLEIYLWIEKLLRRGATFCTVRRLNLFLSPKCSEIARKTLYFFFFFSYKFSRSFAQFNWLQECDKLETFISAKNVIKQPFVTVLWRRRRWHWWWWLWCANRNRSKIVHCSNQFRII